MLRHAARYALAPVLYAQARRMRALTPQMPEPPGPREGREGCGPDRARGRLLDLAPVRLLVVGDSSAAGVGARSQDEALARPLARGLAARLAVPVDWQLRAATGLTSEGVLHLLMHGHVAPADLALVVVGVNDITHEVPLQHALRRRAEIVQWLHRHAGVGHVVFPALPEIERFPALPQPLGWYAGQHARASNRAQAAWARRFGDEPTVTHVPFDNVLHPRDMAEDGFHPGPRLYARVAARLAEVCGALLAGREDPSGADPTDLGRASERVLDGQSSRASAA